MFLSSKLTTSKGFTLVELMIVISIVAVLALIGLVSYQEVLKNGRDSKRTSDLKIVQSALEQFHLDHQQYPYDDELEFGKALKSRDGLKTYLNTVPSDPQAGFPYCYRSAWSSSEANQSNSCTTSSPGSCQFYYLCAKLENPKSTSPCVCNSNYNSQV